MNDVTVIDLSGNVVDVCIELRRKYKIRLPDAIIAATAIVYDLVLICRNISDFRDIRDLKVVNPYGL